MSITPMDLDSSLDDLIKKRRNNNNNNKKQNSNKSSNQGRKQQQQQNKPRHSLNVQSKGRVSKPSQPQRSGINSRLSTSSSKVTVSGPIFTSKNHPQQQQQQQRKADPSQIIITKAIAPGFIQSRIGGGGGIRSKSSSSSIENKSILNGRLGKQPQPQQLPEQQPRVETTIYRRPTEGSTRVSNFSIRGRSATVAPTTGYSIKGESGPTLILVTGLDPGANSDDVKVAFEPFGNILRCEVLRDRQGRSFGEAEIEFSTKNAALDCIAELDNQLADGHYLRVILRENKPKPSSYSSAKQIHSVIATPSYSASGKMYADQMTPSRYDIRRQ